MSLWYHSSAQLGFIETSHSLKTVVPPPELAFPETVPPLPNLATPDTVPQLAISETMLPELAELGPAPPRMKGSMPHIISIMSLSCTMTKKGYCSLLSHLILC